MLSHTMPHVRVLHAVTNNKFHICKDLAENIITLQ